MLLQWGTFEEIPKVQQVTLINSKKDGGLLGSQESRIPKILFPLQWWTVVNSFPNQKSTSSAGPFKEMFWQH